AIGSPARASTARLGVTQDDLRHLQIVAVTSLPETFRNAVTVLRVAILAHLPLALESRDRKTEPDDASQHHIDVARGSVREHPWLSFVPLLLRASFADTFSIRTVKISSACAETPPVKSSSIASTDLLRILCDMVVLLH